MHSFFINRQYPAAIVDRAMSKAFSIDGISVRIPFTITFHTVNNLIKPIVNRNFNYLIQILAALLIFLVNARFFFHFFLSLAIFALFWLKEQ